MHSSKHDNWHCGHRSPKRCSGDAGQGCETSETGIHDNVLYVRCGHVSEHGSADVRCTRQD
eukprot:14783727-Alexandrium_andersonii.AAC.1